MRIGINTHFLKYPASGIGQYSLHLTNTLLGSDQQNEYRLIGPANYVGARYPHFQVIHPVPAWARGNANRAQFYWEQRTAPLAAQKSQVDVFHYPYFAAPLFSRQPVIVTIPDLIQLRIPQYLAGPSKQAYVRMNMLAASRAAMIITFSEHAKQDIIELMHIPAKKIRVISIAAGDEYRPIADPLLQAEVCARYGLGGRYIFYLGGLDLRKNVLQLVRAFALLTRRLADPALQLCIAGDPDKQIGPTALFPDPRPLAAALGVTERIVYRFVEENDKAALYSGAQIFVFPSLYEGFGLPPLEAMKCGAPVICSNLTSLPEVVGDAAFNLHPADTDALVEAMYAILTNQALRTQLSARSLERASLFSWSRTANQTLAVYEEVFTRSKNTHGRALPGFN